MSDRRAVPEPLPPPQRRRGPREPTSGSGARRARRRPHHGVRRRGPAVTCVLAVMLLGGCGGDPPVRLTGLPDPTGTDSAACAALTAGLPASLGTGLNRRTLDPPTPLAAAWGANPAVLTCGVAGRAATYRPEAHLAVVDEVGWFVERDGDAVRYSTPTRQPQVVLALPADMQAFEVLVTLAPAVRRHTTPATP